ncbi:NAD(P)H-dependent oxidoreductase subunit E [Pseudomonadota bacterium]
MQTGNICSATERILKLRNYPRKQPYLIAALEDVQTHFGFLPEAAVAIVLDYFGQTLDFDSELSALFHFSSDNPNAIRICAGPLCSKAGSSDLIKAVRTASSIAVMPSYCLGACSQPPAAEFNGETISPASADKILALLKFCGDTG